MVLQENFLVAFTLRAILTVNFIDPFTFGLVKVTLVLLLVLSVENLPAHVRDVTPLVDENVLCLEAC